MWFWFLSIVTTTVYAQISLQIESVRVPGSYICQLKPGLESVYITMPDKENYTATSQATEKEFNLTIIPSFYDPSKYIEFQLLDGMLLRHSGFIIRQYSAPTFYPSIPSDAAFTIEPALDGNPNHYSIKSQYKDDTQNRYIYWDPSAVLAKIDIDFTTPQPTTINEAASFIFHYRTNGPTLIPTKITKYPTNIPSLLTKYPTKIPTNIPTKQTLLPTNIPTHIPTNIPTKIPSKIPTNIPSLMPSKIPTKIPTNIPSKMPSKIPTKIPTNIPSIIPTNIPTKIPTKLPTNMPSNIPSKIPTKIPTNNPTKIPTKLPTNIPSNIPSIIPTLSPVKICSILIIKTLNKTINNVNNINVCNINDNIKCEWQDIYINNNELINDKISFISNKNIILKYSNNHWFIDSYLSIVNNAIFPPKIGWWTLLNNNIKYKLSILCGNTNNPTINMNINKNETKLGKPAVISIVTISIICIIMLIIFVIYSLKKQKDIIDASTTVQIRVGSISNQNDLTSNQIDLTTMSINNPGASDFGETGEDGISNDNQIETVNDSMIALEVARNDYDVNQATKGNVDFNQFVTPK